MEELPKKYDPKQVEDRIYNLWIKSGVFAPKIDVGKKPYTITIPPPNVTGSLHIGHALNNTIQDILIRRSRMMGVPTLWLPGTDHAGIATQNVVEKKLQKENKTRHDLGREEFIKQVWDWVNQYGHIIIDQLKALGCSCDWSRQRFTLDEGYAKSVEKAFIYYFKKGWIYQGERVINWCPRCQTALSDIELEYREVEGKLWYIRYPLKGHPERGEAESPALTRSRRSRKDLSRMRDAAFAADSSPLAQNDKYIIVATTRPETMVGDTAVAVNPNDNRYKNMVGKKVILPLINREIPIIADDAVDPKFGTGAVKVTPAHDMNDFEIGERHKLESIKVINEYGRITPQGCQFAGQKSLEARENILKDLESKSLLEKIQDHIHQVPYCYRCGKTAEQLTSKQWFVKMSELAKPAIKAVEKEEIKFVPARWKKVYLDWMKNLKDWCISRQIWWGHRLPVWQPISHSERSEESPTNVGSEINSEILPPPWRGQNDVYVGNNPPKGYEQSNDVLDTWFSSALWPFATLGWPIEQTSKIQSNKKINLIIARHGEADHNPNRLCSGDPKNIYHLTQTGKKQAAALSQKLKGKKIDIIYVSELHRTQETAEIVKNELNLNIPIQIDKRLNDVQFGKLEGQVWDDVVKKTNKLTRSIEGSELASHILKRTKSFLDDLTQEKNQNILIIAHEANSLAFRRIKEGLEFESYDYLPNERYHKATFFEFFYKVPQKYYGSKADLEYFYPTAILSTARDIIYLWVARMIFSGIEFMGKKPFEVVYIHPTILTYEGQRMSKSLGTGVDPIDLIEKYGADATRFGLTYINTGIQDIRFDENVILAGQKFANKIWNISRFVLLQIGNSKQKIASPPKVGIAMTPKAKTQNDKEILEKLDKLIKSTNSNFDNFRFGQAAHEIYDFIWHDFADQYLEKSKKQLDDGKIKKNTQGILLYVLQISLKLLHPIMPYITEEVWSKLPGKKEMLIISVWPK